MGRLWRHFRREDKFRMTRRVVGVDSEGLFAPSPLLAHLDRVVRERRDHDALLGPGRVGYGDLWTRSNAAARALEAEGFAGARVALLTGDGPTWTIAFLGALMAGGTAVALSPLYPEGELRWFTQASGARALLASSDLAETAMRVVGAPAAPLGEGIVAVAPPGSTGADREAPPRDGAALLLYTSGTTGRPKGALLSHEAVLAQATALGEAWRFSADDVLLHALPLHHLHGIGVALLVALTAGATVRFVPGFDPAFVWEELGRATVWMGVPTQHKKLFDAFDSADEATRARWQRHARGLRLVTSGSAALSPALGERWRALTGKYPLERYGMTEIGIVLSNPEDGERRPGSVGLPLPGVGLRIVAEGGGDAPADEPGELCVRAPTMFSGYDRSAEATRAAFTGGWFRTGDTASRAADGYVRILGRTSTDILKSGGYKLSALEIEDVLREHDAVADVAVVGVPDETWGDLVVAVVVPRPGRAADAEESAVRDWAKARLPGYKVPKRVVVKEELPRNALGKVTKAALVSDFVKRGFSTG